VNVENSQTALAREKNDLASFGYREELARSLGSFSSFAAGFSYISILTGMFQLFYLGFHAGGPGFFWSWPLVFAGQMTVALCFAELAAHYPVAGGVYQWAKLTVSPFMGRLTGLVYLACLIVTLAAVSLALQNTLPQIWEGFQVFGKLNNPLDSAQNAVFFACLVILLSTLINTVGVGFLSKINNVGVTCELLGIAALIVLLALHLKRGALGTIVPQAPMGNAELRSYLPSFFAATALTASYVLFGFDTAGSLAEETLRPRERAPRAILQALLAAGISGGGLLLLALMATGSLHSPELSTSGGGLGFIVRESVGETWGKILLCDVVIAIIACVLAVHSGIVRLIFSMARDESLPFSSQLSQVDPRSKLPLVPVLVSAGMAIALLLVNLRFPKIVELVTSLAALWANLAYLLVGTGLLYRRFHGWPALISDVSSDRFFTLGRWGMPINLLAVCFSVFMVINIGWPRTAVYGTQWYTLYSPLWLSAFLLVSGTIYFRVTRRIAFVGSALLAGR